MEQTWHLWWAWYPVRADRMHDAAGAAGSMWIWRDYVAFTQYMDGAWGTDHEVTEYMEAERAVPSAWRGFVMHPGDLSERLAAAWRLDPCHQRTIEEGVLDDLTAWTRARQKPRLWHYAIKLWRMLPWR